MLCTSLQQLMDLDCFLKSFITMSKPSIPRFMTSVSQITSCFPGDPNVTRFGWRTWDRALLDYWMSFVGGSGGIISSFMRLS